MLVFAFSYFLRFLWDAILVPLIFADKEDGVYDSFYEFVANDVMFVFYDIIPLSLILYNHCVNFRGPIRMQDVSSFLE